MPQDLISKHAEYHYSYIMIVASNSILSSCLTSRNQSLFILLSTGIEEDVMVASRLSYAHDFISSFPEGYLTDVGASSVMVSGGQKQVDNSVVFSFLLYN